MDKAVLLMYKLAAVSTENNRCCDKVKYITQKNATSLYGFSADEEFPVSQDT